MSVHNPVSPYVVRRLTGSLDDIRLLNSFEEDCFGTAASRRTFRWWRQQRSACVVAALGAGGIVGVMLCVIHDDCLELMGGRCLPGYDQQEIECLIGHAVDVRRQQLVPGEWFKIVHTAEH